MQDLALTGIDGLSAAGLVATAQPALRYRLWALGFGSLAGRCLDLERCVALDDDSLAALARTARRLSVLSLHSAALLSGEGLLPALALCVDLTVTCN